MNPIFGISEKFCNNVFENENGCWVWSRAKTSAGYGLIWLNRSLIYTHKYSYEFFKGKTSKGFDIDHLCRNRGCCNPDHLELVTHKENCRRGIRKMSLKACKHGHPYLPGTFKLVERKREKKDERYTYRHCLLCKRK